METLEGYYIQILQSSGAWENMLKADSLDEAKEMLRDLGDNFDVSAQYRIVYLTCTVQVIQ